MPMILKSALFLFLFFTTAAQAGPSVPGIGLEFGSDQVESARFETVPPEAGDPDIMKSFRGDRGEVMKIIVRDSLSQAAADEYMKSRIVQLKVQFTPQAAPYTGALTVSSECLSRVKLQNKIRDNGKSRSVVFLLSATEEFVYGTCMKEREKYFSQNLLIYCKEQRRYYDVRFFTKREGRLSLKPIARCRAD